MFSTLIDPLLENILDDSKPNSKKEWVSFVIKIEPIWPDIFENVVKIANCKIQPILAKVDIKHMTRQII